MKPRYSRAQTSSFCVLESHLMIKISSILGAFGGLVYTILGVTGAYKRPPIPLGFGQGLFDFLVLAAFTIPFGAAIGVGVGLILHGVLKRK